MHAVERVPPRRAAALALTLLVALGGGVAACAGSEVPSDEQLDAGDRPDAGVTDAERDAHACTPKAEVCDGVDNDCNGVVDDPCACLPGDIQPCYSGAAGTEGIGPCHGGTHTCDLDGLAWGPCAGEVAPATEMCDGADNDCNGLTDEGCQCMPGDTKTCYSGATGTAGVGRCRSGDQTCNPDGRAWGTCLGEVVPTTETCNGEDDDCNGTTDDADLVAVCGAVPPHGSWRCDAGGCSPGPCVTGWTQYPPAAPADGCLCPVDAAEPNGTCAAAALVGSVSDAGGTLAVSGTLSSDTDVDFLAFDTVDVDEGTTNSYRVAIDFTAPTPNDEFVMDVMRGAPCVETPAGGATGLTTYDWCANGNDGLSPRTGAAVCGPTDVIHCGNYSVRYYLRVYRRTGAPGTCTPYQLTISGGAGACRLPATCG